MRIADKILFLKNRIEFKKYILTHYDEDFFHKWCRNEQVYSNYHLRMEE